MKRAFIGTLALSLAAGIVSAQDVAPPAATSPGMSQGAAAATDFNSLDANRDGRVSAAEARSHAELSSSFATLDADKDSYLSQSEFDKWNKGSSAPRSPSSPSGNSSPAPTSPDTTRSTSGDLGASPGAEVDSAEAE
jgi:hypothetical protein